MSNMYRGSFRLGLDELCGFYHLVQQRVAQQNEATLAEFTTKVFFEDEGSITLKGFEDLRAFNEVRPVSSIGAQLNWVFLIKFQDKKNPEQQEISVTFLAEPSWLSSDDGVPIYLVLPGPRFDPDGNAKWVGKLMPASVRTIDRAGGTTLHTARVGVNPSVPQR